MDDGKMAPVKAIRPRVAYGDLERMSEDGRRYELYDGEVFVVPSPVPRHQVVAHKIGNLFLSYGRLHGGIVLISPIDIVFSEFDVVQPDVVFFTHTRAHLVKPDYPIRDTPDVAVEVLSPSTATTDRGKKMQLLARYGVPEYWLVDPRARTVEIYSLSDQAYVLGQVASAGDLAHARTLPNLSFAVDEMFSDW